MKFASLAAMMVRDLKLYARHPGESARPILFFLMIGSLFPMAMRMSPQSLGELAPAIIWVSSMLAILVSLENVLKTDFEDGSLEQLLLSPYPLAPLLLGKLFAHWLATGVPILLMAPVLGVLLNLPLDGFLGLLGTLLIGLPTMSLMAAIGAALTIGLRQGGLFLALLVLPLMVPVLLFGASGTLAASQGLPFLAEVSLLGALFLLALVFGPLVIAYAVRVSVQ